MQGDGRPGQQVLTRMTRDAPHVTLLRRVRTLATTAAAIVLGLVRVVTHREPPAAQLQVGDPAPQFTLPGSDGRVYRLSDYAGRQAVVLAWFPKAFTGGCTAECESIGLSRAAIGTFDVAWFGASVDRPETNRRFAASMGIDFPILSDTDARVARAYGVLGPAGFPMRWTFYIGANGRILAIDKAVRTATHGADIAAALDAMKVSRRP